MANMSCEPQKMAMFLKQRCDEGQYGLYYVNGNSSLIYIPWPVAPRPNENMPLGFQLFREWASLSFKKRNAKLDGNEAATTQKHRFRNALARADGIEFRKDIQIPGGRVYEFVDSKSTRKYSDENLACISSPFENGVNGYSVHDVYQNVSASGWDYVPNQFNGSQPMPNGGIDYRDGTGVQDPPFLCEELEFYGQGFSPESMGAQETDPLDRLLHLGELNGHAEPSQAPVSCPSPQMIPHEQQQICMAPVQADDPVLNISLYFRSVLVQHFYVSNRKGARLYYGSNVPDMTQLFEPSHLANITLPFKYDAQVLFGPNFLQQVKLPEPVQSEMSPTQWQKTKSILDNMARGLILCMDESPCLETNGVPDVYAMRLCQTRIFPGPPGNENCPRQPELLSCAQSETLKRMEWTKVFDARVFYGQLMSWSDAGTRLSPKFSLSLGQRNTDENLLVCLSVTVQGAQRAMQSRLDDLNREDLCISKETSMDMEAKRLALTLRDKMTLEISAN